ncbi:hypothetical protein IAT38_005240 [Cryptococcus sp. DSM 104549]
MSSPAVRWAKFTFYSGLIIASGVWLQANTVPNSKELYDSLSPELKGKADQIARNRSGTVNMKEQLLAAGEKDEVIWANDLSTKRPPPTRIV